MVTTENYTQSATEHASGAGAAKFSVPAQTYFRDSRSPLRSRSMNPPAPAPVDFFTPAHRSALTHSVFGPLRSDPVPLTCSGLP